jgi:hypothetical protein
MNGERVGVEGPSPFCRRFGNYFELKVVAANRIQAGSLWYNGTATK